MRAKARSEDRPQMPIAPMIDVVFLVLIYFMVTSSLERQEADMSFQLPGVVEQSEPLEMPDEQIIELRADGQVVVNEFVYDANRPPRGPLPELTAMLARFRQASDANQVEAIVTIAPDDSAVQADIVRVMDACDAAGISNVNFALGE